MPACAYLTFVGIEGNIHRPPQNSDFCLASFFSKALKRFSERTYRCFLALFHNVFVTVLHHRVPFSYFLRNNVQPSHEFEELYATEAALHWYLTSLSLHTPAFISQHTPSPAFTPGVSPTRRRQVPTATKELSTSRCSLGSSLLLLKDKYP